MSEDYSNWEHCLQVSAVSDLGLRRANNQDSMTVALARNEEDWREAGHLFVVADGMGAHAAGELASKLAVDQVAHLYRKHLDMSPTAAIADAILEANDEIHRRGQANLAFHNMGTTCSSLVLLPQGALLAHVGDSRVYRLRGNKLQQLTFDHSLVWEMRHAGKQGEIDGKGIPKNVITRSLGPHQRVKVDLEGPFPVEIGDTFLLCSDGLTGCINDTEIAGALATFDADDATRLLVNLANLRGAPDNVTTIVIKVTGEQMTTRSAKAAPLTVGESNEPHKPAPVWTWISLGILLLLSGVLWAMGNHFWSLIAAGLSAIPGLLILAIESGVMRDGGIQLTAGKRLGKAPYQTAHAAQAAEFADHLQQTIDEFCQAAKRADWDIDWGPIDVLQEKIRAEIAADDTPSALANLLSLSDMMTDYCRARREARD
jgi:serine/threonine protein phosphatase PrpC